MGKGARGKQVVAQQLQGLFLLGGGQRFERQAISRVAHVVAAVIYAANVLRREEKRVARFSEGRSETAPEDLVALAGLLELLFDVRPNLLGQFNAVRVILQRIAAQVKAVHHGVHVKTGTKSCVFVSCVSQFGVRRPGCNLA